MVLQRQKFVVSLGKGLDTYSDPKFVVPGKLTALENAVFKKGLCIDKRFAATAMSATTSAGATLAAGTGLATLKDELLLADNNTLYSYAPSNAKWVSRGTLPGTQVTTEQIIKNGYVQTDIDCGSANGVEVYAYLDNRSTIDIRATVIDRTTGTTLISDLALATSTAVTGTNVRCVQIGNYVYVIYRRLTTIYAKRLDTTSPMAFDATEYTLATGATASGHFDAVNFNNQRIALTYIKTSSLSIGLTWVVTSGTSGIADQTITPTSGTVVRVCVFADNTNSKLCVLWGSSTLGMCYSVRSAVDGSQISAPAVVDAAATSTVVNAMTGAWLNGSAYIYYTVSGSTSYNCYTKTATISAAGAITSSAATLVRSVCIRSRAFIYGGRIYFLSIQDSYLQPSYFLIEGSEGIVAARMLYSLGPLSALSALSNIPALVTAASATSFYMAMGNTTEIYSDGGSTNLRSGGVSKLTIDFVSDFSTAELGDTLHIAGGQPALYDGRTLAEQGFNLYPENLTLTATAGNTPALGTYSYIACYEWLDNNGQLHRSAPSIPYSITTTVAATQAVSVVVPTLRLTRKANVMVVLYRSEEGPGALYYRCTSKETPTFNSTSSDSVTIVDVLPDAQLIKTDILYTTGGVLDNFQAPPHRHVTRFKNRLVLTGMENKNKAAYSKAWTAGEPVEFAEDLTIDVLPDTSCGAVIDDKLLLFTPHRIQFTYGDGPNNAGLGSEYPTPQDFVLDIGCDNGKKLVGVTDGIIFQSAKGFYQVGGGRNVQYIGAGVDNYKGLAVTSGALLADYSQVRFTCSDGATLVWDYLAGEWGTFNGDYQGALASVNWGSQYTFINSAGGVLYEDTSAYESALSFTTGWIALDTVVGLQRIYKLAILGNYKSAHSLTVSVAYDYDDTYTETYTFNTTTGMSAGEAYRFAVSLSRQKCQALKIKVADDATSSQGYSINAIGLLAGVKGSMGKYSASKQIGSN